MNYVKDCENIKQQIKDIIKRIKEGEFDPTAAWNKIRELKEKYVQHCGEQSRHSHIRKRELIYSILTGYFVRLASRNPKL